MPAREIRDILGKNPRASARQSDNATEKLRRPMSAREPLDARRTLEGPEKVRFTYYKIYGKIEFSGRKNEVSNNKNKIMLKQKGKIQ